MHTSVLYGLVGLAALAAYKLLVTVFTKFQNAAKARRLGCQDAPWYPDIGILGIKHLKLMRAAEEKYQFTDLLVERYRTISAHVGRAVHTFKYNILGQDVYTTCEPENIKAMLATQFHDFDLGQGRRDVMGETLGAGIFTIDGKQWEHSRAMLRPNFVREQVSDLDMEERHVQTLLSVMPVQQDGWTDYVDLQTRFFRLTIDAATEFLYGESVESQKAEAEIEKMNAAQAEEIRARSFGVNFDQAQWHMARKFRFGDLHWLYRPAGYKENGRIVNDFIAKYVDLALSKSPAELAKHAGEEGSDKYIFLDALARQTRDPVELRSELLNILLAGRDTTASLLSWFFHQLVRHPDVFEKLRATIIDTFGTFDQPREITFAALKGCQYLQQCLSETNRLWSVVPNNARRSLKDTTLPRGGGPRGDLPLFIPKDTLVEYSIYAMHRRTDLWGEDAEVFRPERFANRRPGWEFLPFNGGPRICIGQQFALTEAAYVIVRLLQKFDKLEAPADDLQAPTLSNLSLTNAPARPVTLRLREAKA